MPKGLYSQCFCILTDGRCTVEDVRLKIESAGFSRTRLVSSLPGNFNSPALVLPYRPEVNGSVTIDAVGRPWPDDMGDPKRNVETFGNWALGCFGPFTYPGGLARAIQHAWAWASANSVVPAHCGFIRFRTTYLGGLEDDAPILPNDYDPVDELMFVSRLILATQGLPGMIGYFNPSGEVLRDLTSFQSVFSDCAAQQVLPLLLWSNIRLFNVNSEYGLMDTVGNLQFDVKDIEAVYPLTQYNPSEIDNYLRNVTQYLLDSKCELLTGESIDGPGESQLSWIIESREQAIVSPPRSVIRLCPRNHRKAIDQAVMAATNPR